MESLQKPRFYAYCRESVDLVSGIEIQKEAIKKYCDAYDIEITKWFIDNAFSAYTLRPGFEKLWESLDNCDGVIVNDLTRFGRDDADLLYRFNELKEKGKRLILIKEGMDTQKPETEFFIKILALFADRERRLIRERLSAGQAYARVHGTKSGKPTHRPTKIIDAKKYDDMAKKGLSNPSIAKMLGVSKSKLYNWIKERK